MDSGIENYLKHWCGYFVISYLTFWYFIQRLAFISFLIILLLGTHRIFSAWRLLLFLLFVISDFFCFVMFLIE